jgi:hypothetical protein
VHILHDKRQNSQLDALAPPSKRQERTTDFQRTHIQNSRHNPNSTTLANVASPERRPPRLSLTPGFDDDIQEDNSFARRLLHSARLIESSNDELSDGEEEEEGRLMDQDDHPMEEEHQLEGVQVFEREVEKQNLRATGGSQRSMLNGISLGHSEQANIDTSIPATSLATLSTTLGTLVDLVSKQQIKLDALHEKMEKVLATGGKQKKVR